MCTNIIIKIQFHEPKADSVLHCYNYEIFWEYAKKNKKKLTHYLNKSLNGFMIKRRFHFGIYINLFSQARTNYMNSTPPPAR